MVHMVLVVGQSYCRVGNDRQSQIIWFPDFSQPGSTTEQTDSAIATQPPPQVKTDENQGVSNPASVSVACWMS
jgi:hypothetical protein